MTRATLTAVLAVMVMLAAGSPTAAQDGLAMMKVESGARPAGMGGAFTAVAGTPDAMPYNPAGTFGVEDFAVSLGHTSYWENVRFETGHAVFRLSPRVSLHGGVRFAAIDELEQRNYVPSEEPLSLFDAHDISFKGGLAVRINPRLRAGFAIGWMVEKIDAWRGSSFAMDYGLQYVPTDRLTVGAAVTNLGSDMTLTRNAGDSSRPIELPTTWRAGAAYEYERYRGALDMVYLDEEAHAHIGAEAQVHELFQVRAGYMSGYDVKNITAGASFSRRNLAVDYAFVPYTKNLGATHMFNLTFTM